MGRGRYAALAIEPEAATKTGSPPEKKKKKFLSTPEAAEYLEISIPTLRKYRELGQIPFRRIGERIYKYETADLDEFARKVRRA
ncbi:MAG: helix-turn-helix domain-containing protein [Mycobacterium sp.]